MKTVTKVLSFIIFFSTLVMAQGELNFDFDYARFKYDSSSVYLEFYYNLNSKNMVQVDYKPGEKLSQAIVHIEMKNAATDSFLIKRDWKIQNVIAGTDTVEGVKNLSGTFGFPIPAGNYSLLVKVWDANNDKLNKTIKENIQILPYVNEKFAISDLELANNIKHEGADPKSIFYKNTLEVFPNPSMLFSAHSPVAFYYAELYNLKLQDSSSDFTLQKLLYNSTGTNIYKNLKKIKSGPNSIVEYGLINLSKYPTDSYNLVLSLIDNKTNQAFLSSKRFYLYNPKVIDSTARKTGGDNALSSEFGIMTAEECDKMFAEARYVATEAEIDRYNSLDSLNAKRNFLINFWKGRDTDPSTPQNEFEIDYMRRVEYANEHFRHANKEGYRSDRGRVYLLYGEPDQKDFYPNEPNLKPYEVWFYSNIEGGVTFIFGDLSGFGNYELLHSTKRGEVKDDNWQRRISTE